MAYNRRLGADDGTVLMACSICGIPFRYPGEIRLSSDKLFRCNTFCTETTNKLDEARKHGQSTKQPDEAAPRFRVGVAPDWY